MADKAVGVDDADDMDDGDEGGPGPTVALAFDRDRPAQGLRRYRLLVEYHGSGFVGWQVQGNGLSVQQALEDAVQAATGERRTVHGAGRTDTGVHASGMVAHVDLARDMEPERLLAAVNFHVKPHAVSVVDAVYAAEGFHARFSAIQRAYRYRILARRAPPALERGRVWHVPRPLDSAAMAEAAKLLEGRHDFTSFRAAACQAASPVKTLDALDVVAAPGEEVHIHARARSFLHNQVRIIAGTLKAVGVGRLTPGDVAAALAARDRAAAGQTAPPEGLCLTEVRYPAALGG